MLEMITDPTFIAYAVSTLATFLLPIVLIAYLCIKKKTDIEPAFYGVAAYIISQVILQRLLLSLISRQDWFIDLENSRTTLLLILFTVCLSAALFAEGSRLGSAALLEKHRNFKGILSFALGYAFCEAIVQTGYTQARNIFICFDKYFSTDELADFDLFLHLSKNPVYAYLGIVERFSTAVFHIFATYLVFTGLVQKKIRYPLFAVIAHTVFRLTGLAPVSYFPDKLSVLVITEILLLAMALAAGYYTATRGTWRLEDLRRGKKAKDDKAKSDKAKGDKAKGDKAKSVKQSKDKGESS
jgi:uncharacterized membrane protein YhfC